MPPRKSTSSVTPAETDEPIGATPTATQQQLKAQAEGGVNVEDYLLPRSLTLRLAKSVLPPNTAIQKDALLAIQKAATVFVSYVASHANESTLKRTLSPTDVLSALSELEFDNFKPRLEQELALHTDLANSKRKAKKGPGGTEQTTVTQQAETQVGSQTSTAERTVEKDTVPLRGAKRVKREGETSPEAEVDDDDETQEEEEEEVEVEEEDEDETQEEGDEEEEEEEEEEETQNDNERVEDLDQDTSRRQMGNPDALDSDAGSDSDYDDGPGAQLREDLGLG